MLVLLPVLALGAGVLVIKARTACWREAILGGAVLWGTLLVGITEVLSMFQGLTLSGLTGAWLVALLVLAAFATRFRAPGQLSMLGPSRLLDRVHAALLGALAVIVLVLGFIAVFSPPNTWDSMTYHMARLIHWSQAATIAPYPTHILRQLYLAPGAEYVLLHLQILSGGDHLAGLVQWASMLGVLSGTSLVALDLGARSSGALCAAVFAESLPIGILEATSTQNDYVVAFWTVCVAASALRMTRSFGTALPWATTATFGASVGLAILTKATAYLLVAPVVVWVTIWIVRRFGWRGLRLLVLAAVIALALNLGFYSRNLLVFGSPIGPLDEGAPSLRYINAALTPSLVASNVLRDVGVNFNATPSAAINVRTLNFVRLVHTWLNVDIADPRSTWGEEVFSEEPIGLAFDENFASNPVHTILIAAALAALWPLRRRLSPTVTAYALALTSGFLVFCVVLRWQPWDTRLELPFFVLAAPLVGVVAERFAARFAVVLAALLLASVLPWVVYNQARPLLGPRSILAVSRSEQYFTNRPSTRAAYLGAVEYLVRRQCAHLGFVSTVDGWEYPLWPLLRAGLPGAVEIEHVGVENVSAPLANVTEKQFQPCAVIALGPKANMQSIELNGETYQPSWAALDPNAALEQVSVLTEAEH